jgi:hypothetical protein
VLLILAAIITGFTAYKAYRLVAVGPAHRYSVTYGVILLVACVGAWLAFVHAKRKTCQGVLWFGYIGLVAIVGMSVLDYVLCQEGMPWILYWPILGTLILKRTNSRRATWIYGAVVGSILLAAAILYNEPAGALGLIGTAVQLPITRKT